MSEAMGVLENSAFATSLQKVLQFIENEVGRQRQGMVVMRMRVQQALSTANSESLRSCRLEVIGSTSWDGDVPQSNIDIALCTPQLGCNKSQMISILEDLRRCLCYKSKWWKHIKVIRDAKVPTLQLEDSVGCRCDISVDQVRAIRHRDFLLRALDDRPQVRNVIRLLKFWLRQRGLPLGCQGGITSLAWVFAALSLADQQPCGTSLEVLTMHVFSELHKMGTLFLCVCRDMLGGGLKVFWQNFVSTWGAEWTELFRVEDPIDTQRHITQSIPTSLGLLYVAELRLAWYAIRESNFDRFWASIAPEAKMELPSIFADRSVSIGKTHHLVLKEGLLYFGEVQYIMKCSLLPKVEVLHRRDQSSQLHLELLEQSGTMASKSCLSFQPCHWVCAVPSAEISLWQGDSVSRLAEFAQLLGVPRLSQRLQSIVNANLVCSGQQMPMNCVWMPVPMIRWPDRHDEEAPLRGMQSCRSQIEDAPLRLNESELQATPTTSEARRGRGFRIQAKYHCESNQTPSLIVDLASDQSTQASDIEDTQLEKCNGNDGLLSADNFSIDHKLDFVDTQSDLIDDSLLPSDTDDMPHEVENIEIRASDDLQNGQHKTQVYVSQQLSSDIEEVAPGGGKIDSYQIHADYLPHGQHSKHFVPSQQLESECVHPDIENHIVIPETSMWCVATELYPDQGPEIASCSVCSIVCEVLQTDEKDRPMEQVQAVLESSTIILEENGSVDLDAALEPAALGAALVAESSTANMDVNYYRGSLRKVGKKRARAKGQAIRGAIVKTRVAQERSMKLSCSTAMHGQNNLKGARSKHIPTVFIIGVILAVVVVGFLLLCWAAHNQHTRDYEWGAVRPQSAPAGMQTVARVTRTLDVEIARAHAMVQHIRRRVL